MNKELKNRLVELCKEKFKLRFERTNNSEFKKWHLIKRNRRNIAKILTILKKK
jgi:ribosomal protein L29